MESRYEYHGRELPALPAYNKEEILARHRQRQAALSAQGGQDPHAGGRALRRRVKTMVCALAFLALFSLRLLAPGLGEKIDEGLLDLIDGGWDYKSALASVGSFVSEEGALAVTAMFGEKKTAEPAGPGPALRQAQSRLDAALRAHGEDRPPTAAEPEAEEEQTPESVLPDPVAVFLESQSDYADLAFPADASYEMPELGLACTAPALGAVTDSFGWRLHPLEGEIRFHYGTDVGAEEGSDVAAFADGEVYAVGDSTSLGNYVILDHGNGLLSQYGHCQEVLVSAGEQVAAGQCIARVGRTGAVTGAHLHFELSRDGKRLNPAYYVDFTGGEA